MSYAAVMRRMTDNIAKKCEITGEEPKLDMVIEMVALRSMIVKNTTTQTEIAAIRHVLGEMIEGNVSHQFSDHRWALEAPHDDIASALHAMKSTKSEITSLAHAVIRDIREKADGRTQMTEEELIDTIAGVGLQRQTVQNKGARAISWREFLSFELNLSDEDPETTFNDLVQGKASIRGLTRVFGAAMFLTGMRPVEIWTSRLLVPDLSMPFTADLRNLIYASPAQALLHKLYVTVESAARSMEKGLGETAILTMESKQAPAILMIESAKQTNANDARSQFRLLIIDKPSARDLTLLAWATQFRRLPLGDERRDNLRAAITREVKKIARSEDNIKRNDLNLYSFRHAFINRVRREYYPHEAAALCGHTSRSSLYAYGETRVKRSRASGSDGKSWLPKPDPVQAEAVRRIWAEPEAARDLRKVAEPEI